jgi:hypothetical protein
MARKTKSKSKSSSATSSGKSKSQSTRRASRKKSTESPVLDDARRQRRRRRMTGLVWMMLIIFLAAGAGWGMRRLEQRILAGENGQSPPRYRIVLVDRPEQMPPLLARRIAQELRPEEADFFDADLVQRIHQQATSHPWVRDVGLVRKRRTNDPNLAVVEVRATYRKPVAVVRYQGQNTFVDADGVVLRDGQTYRTGGRVVSYNEVPRWRVSLPDGRSGTAANEEEIPPSATKQRIHYVGIDGVAPAPPQPGRVWDAADLRAAIRLIQLFEPKPYGHEVTWVDVTNFNWRATPRTKKEPQLKVYAQIDHRKPTEIRWGQFPRKGGDWIVSPARKMGNLDEWVAARGGRLSGWKDWIDLRYDHILTSRE